MTERTDPSSGLPVPEPPLSNRDFELVIRRAAELQARESESAGQEGMSRLEVVRIGRELGLSTKHLHQALAEVASGEQSESGLLARLFGPLQVRAGRSVAGEMEQVAQTLERYLVEREFLTVVRRFPGRVLLTRASGIGAAVGRATSQLFGRSPLLKVTKLEFSVQPLEEGFAYVALATALTEQRTAAAAGSFLGGGSGAAFIGAALGIAIAPPAALIALPVLGGAVYGGHLYYENVTRKIEQQFESLLDRLQHGELPPALPRWPERRR